jgi:hypothetical protein
MSLIHSAAARLLAVSALATLSLTTVAEAQMYGQGQGGGGMMGGGWRVGMGDGLRNGRSRRDRRAFARACRPWYRCHGIPSPQSVSRIIPLCSQCR